MPWWVPQHMKSLKTIATQPKNLDTSRIDAIMCMDIAGKSGNDIAAELGMQPTRISVIRHTPLYMQQRDEMRAKLREQFSDKQTDRLVSGDPVEQVLKDAALAAAKVKIDLMQNSRSEFVKSSAAGDVLDRAGYKAHQDKTIVSVQITEKMADRFERAITYTRKNNTTVTQPTQPINHTTAVEETVEGGMENGGTDSVSSVNHNTNQTQPEV